MTEAEIERTLALLLSVNEKLDKLLQALGPQKPLWLQATAPSPDPRFTEWRYEPPLVRPSEPLKSVDTVYYFETSSTNPNDLALVKPPTEIC